VRLRLVQYNSSNKRDGGGSSSNSSCSSGAGGGGGVGGGNASISLHSLSPEADHCHIHFVSRSETGAAIPQFFMSCRLSSSLCLYYLQMKINEFQIPKGNDE